jgi:cellulose synthase/poly-beta-1,6-N-acetylglucosamine synthase-like glycosyltransferase
MRLAEAVLWTSALVIAYTYLLYPGLLFLVYAAAQVRADFRYLVRRRDRRRPPLATEALPPVALVVPAFNEREHLAAKLENLRALDYPADRLQIVFVSDGSTDGTDDVLRRVEDPRLEVVSLPVRGGKARALNAGVARARADILVFSDASTLFMRDALRRLVRHFADPTVGVVCGALTFRGGGDFQHTEGVYWRYESMLRLMEARVGATLTASGAIYALRRQCYWPLAADDLIEDFLIPMHARRLGFRVVLDPEAEAIDFAAGSVADEFARRVRLAVGSFRALRQFLGLRLDPMTAWAFVSHKLLRWLLPFFLLGLLASNLLLLDRPLYLALFLAQAGFYLWGLLGWRFGAALRRVRFGLLAYFLLAIHMAFLWGFMRLVSGRGSVAWRRP